MCYNHPLLRAFYEMEEGYEGADEIRRLLEAGASLEDKTDEGSVFHTVDQEIVFACVEMEDEATLDRWLHGWLVMVGFSNTLSLDFDPVKVAEGYEITDFRQHERFDFRIEKDKSAVDGWTLHVIDRATGAVAAWL